MSNISALSSIQNISAATSVNAASSATSPSSASAFSDLLNQALSSVTSTETAAQNEGLALLTGNNQNIHNVVLSAEKAEIALRLTLQVRNKVLDAYNEIMRMQV
jgi:flagellar hook-basal body complex protein FliE